MQNGVIITSVTRNTLGDKIRNSIHGDSFVDY